MRIPQRKVIARHFFLRFTNRASTGFLKDVCQQFQDGAFGEFMDDWGCWGVRVFLLRNNNNDNDNNNNNRYLIPIPMFFPTVFAESHHVKHVYHICLTYIQRINTLGPQKPMNVMKVLRPQNMGEIYNPPKKGRLRGSHGI